MATRKVRIQEKTGASSVDLLHPETQADVVVYDNTESGLEATTVQDAIDELLTSGGSVDDVQNGEGTSLVSNKIATVTPSAIGLGSVVNTGDSATPTENGTTKFTTGGAYTLEQTIYSTAMGSVTLSINSSTYVVTLQAKDMNGNNLGTAQTIDLPLESVVVSGSYDDNTKKIILTLQGGSTVEFSVADLVSGLQTEITSSNKLSSDLVDDSEATNKFVTASEKSQISNIANKANKSTTTSAGTYSAVTVNTDGIVTAGYQSLEYGANVGDTPSANLVTGGLFFEKLS